MGLRGALVVGQLALSLLLLVGAGLLVQSFGRLLAVDPGFAPRGALAAAIDLPRASYPEAPERVAFFDRLLEQTRALPGVEAAGATSQLPMVGGGDTYVHAEGRPPASSAERATAQVRKATPGYFEALQVPLAAGRTFSAADREGAPPAVVINQALAGQLFAEEEPLGQRLVIDLGEAVHAEVVGVVGDVREFGPGSPAPGIMYLAHAQFPGSQLSVVLRTPGDPVALAEPLRAVVRELDPNLPLSRLGRLETLVEGSVAQPRFRALLLGLFAAVALLLAAVGLYGALATFVGQRTHEVGVRMALGAGRADVLRLVVGRGMLLAGLGLGLGVAAAIPATRLLTGLLFGVDALDPLTFLAVPALLAAVALGACLLPALRAARIDPMVAFRAD